MNNIYNITRCSGRDTRRFDLYNSLCSLHVFMGRGGGGDTGHSICARLFIINHDPLNSGNYIHKEITGVSVVGQWSPTGGPRTGAGP